MKKTFIAVTLALFMLIATSTNAQVKSYAGLYGGLSIPTGDFGQGNYDNNQAGFAKKGVTFAFDGAYYFYKNLAIGAIFSFQDQGELTNADVTALSTGYTTSFTANTSTVTAVNRYHNVNILGGPQYSFAFSKFIIDLRASAGIIKNYSTPEITTTLTGVPEQKAIFTQRGSSATVFGYGGDLGFRYTLGEHWNLGLRGAYIDSKGFDVANENRTTSSTGRYVTKQPITEIQTTIGIIHSF